MVENGLATFDPGQRERLAALGFELLVLRAPHRVATEATSPDDSHTSASAAASVRLVLRTAHDAPFSTPQAGLLRALIKALDLSEHEVTTTSIADVPALAFGVQTDTDALYAAEKLDARAKRALWPALRRLRRQLQSADRSA